MQMKQMLSTQRFHEKRNDLAWLKPSTISNLSIVKTFIESELNVKNKKMDFKFIGFVLVHEYFGCDHLFDSTTHPLVQY